MSDDPRADLLKKSTGPLEIPRRVIDESSESWALLTNIVQDVKIDVREMREDRKIVNHAMFEKLDDAAALARTAVTVAESTKAIAAAAHEEVMKINGTVKSLKIDVATLKAKEAEELQAAIVDAAVKVKTEGVIMFTKPKLKTVALVGSIIAGTMTFIATGQLTRIFLWLAAHS